jgi:hypothetical protein
MQNQEKNASVNLNIYVIRFKGKGTSDKELLKVNDVLGDKTFDQKMQDLIRYFDAPYISSGNERILYFHKLDPDYKNNTLYGLMRKGISSEERYVEEVKMVRRKRIASQVATISAEQYTSSHFFFTLCQPEQNAKGILLIAQSFKQYGFKEVFEESFKDYVSKINPDVRCFITQLSIPALYDKIIDESIIKKLTFKRHGLSPEFEDSFISKAAEPGEEFEVSFSVQAKKAGFIGFKNTLKTFRDTDTTFMEVFPLEKFEYQDLSAEVFLGGKRRVLNMTRPQDLGTYYDITADIEFDDKTKHPVYEDIKGQAKAIMNDDILPNVKL